MQSGKWNSVPVGIATMSGSTSSIIASRSVYLASTPSSSPNPFRRSSTMSQSPTTSVRACAW